MRTLIRPQVFIAAGVVVAVLAGALFSWDYLFGLPAGRGASTDLAEAPTTTVATTTTSTTRPPTTTTTLPPIEQPPVFEMPALPAGGLSQGDRGDLVLAYEYRMKALRFDPGEVDGVFDQETRYAVEALQKLNGAERTGRIDDAVRFGLSVFKWPKAIVKRPEPTRVEVDLDRQVMVVYRDREVQLITTVSTGSGRRFCGGDDGCQYATTPPGRFEFTWRYNGWRTSKLGQLYNPVYFNGGIAVHGYRSVPTHPASHGCVRIPMHVADHFPSLVEKGDPIYVVGTPAGPSGSAPGGSSGGATSPPPAAPPPTAPPETAPPATAPPMTVASTAAPTTTVALTTTAPSATTTVGEPAPTTVAPTTTTPTTSPTTTTAGA